MIERKEAAMWRAAGQVLLGAVLLFTGTGHLTFARTEFQAQVPAWIPIDENVVVIASGVVELLLALALLATWRQPARAVVGALTAVFFVAILPGNIAQFTEHQNGFGLDTDAARAIRLLFQPVLVVWALVVTSAVPVLRSLRRRP
ncbi:hypothetical protein M1L60_27350 [Actinoplanes sp. TRM 88003]|uniref:DoxX family membrane protein n=1 Tax=Paractinoplanes aksuensis TaxID=2939490 RepID=A0ABT1DTZ1_9ACTN|nr:MauE/DoxX family redox-associated membrane protein [Actinoplanes aksuensis]MCO8274322.1 hypothetical protein [Actinoplanes aksuensis]